MRQANTSSSSILNWPGGDEDKLHPCGDYKQWISDFPYGLPFVVVLFFFKVDLLFAAYLAMTTEQHTLSQGVTVWSIFFLTTKTEGYQSLYSNSLYFSLNFWSIFFILNMKNEVLLLLLEGAPLVRKGNMENITRRNEYDEWIQILLECSIFTTKSVVVTREHPKS